MIVAYNGKRICGVDEVGRGALAGPVTAAAVICAEGYFNADVRDSKKLSAKERSRLAEEIRENALGVGIGVVCNIIIDKIGIVAATKQAMHMAISSVSAPCDLIIIDAVSLNNLPAPHIHPFKADDTYFETACASIIAKVYRDNLMCRLADIYPAYGFDAHKGYGTAAHRETLGKNGATPLHRRTFIKNII